MYDELVKRLREADEKSMCGECGLNLHTGATKKGVLFAEAADAIEELSRENESLAKSVNEASEILRKRWIPVTERLPKEKTYVLILFDTIAGKMQGVCFLYKDDDGHNCWTLLDRLGKNLFDIQPTHWMPLPEPPKEET